MRRWLLLLLCLASPLQAGSLVVPTADGEEILVITHPAAGERLLVWFPSEAGPQTVDVWLADQLAQREVEVWRADLLEARFLPLADSSPPQVPAGDVAALLTQALRSGKRVFLVANGRSAIPALRGVRQWLLDGGRDPRFGGVILISPKLFVRTPDPGETAEPFPIVAASNVPLYWLQPGKSPWYWKLPQLLPVLEAGGSDVYVRVLHGVRDRFFFRPDANEEEDVMRRRLPELLRSAARALERLPRRERRVVALKAPLPAIGEGKTGNTLKPYRGDPEPSALRLPTLSGKSVDLSELRGRVVLVNFWASWCPPCVHEMPSMQRLADVLRDTPFEILAVNMAEPPEVIREFLDTKVDVDFPILLDRDGAALKRWRVFAFPTSFVIDRTGRIRYALFGAAEWDDPGIVERLRELLDEDPPMNANRRK